MMRTNGKPKQKILAVAGPTASGKSHLAVLLAKRYGGDILSCDSMQIYRDMNIGTAKPTLEEMQGVRHWLLDFADPKKAFSCADYVSLAEKKLEELAKAERLPVFCGGTGLYLDRLLFGGGTAEDTCPDAAVRERLKAFAAENGNHALHEKLRAIDPESAEAIHENNLHRVVRALEIYETTGKTKTQWDRESTEQEARYDACVIGLRFSDRSVLYDRINRRVDRMLKDGLLEETEALRKEGVFEANQTAAQAIGYKELLSYLDGNGSPEEAAERLKAATRRYAKRQMTWFSAKPYVRWIEMDRNGACRPEEEILSEATALADRFLN